MNRLITYLWSAPIISLLLVSAAAGINPSLDDDSLTASIITRYSELMHKRGWTIRTDGSALKAFRFASEYDEINVVISSNRKNAHTTFEVVIRKNDKSGHRTFTFKNNTPEYRDKASTAITAYLISQSITAESATPSKSPHFVWFSAGYSRTHDNGEIFPEKKKGGYSLSMNYTYDPSRLTGLDRVHLGFGDYMMIDMWGVFDSDPVNRNYVNENFFNFDIIFYGTHRQGGTARSGFRFVYGFYTGMEYFRPGWKDNILLWSHELYREQPHIQYMIWRAVGWGFSGNWYTPYGTYSLAFMAGLGPSINSSLFAIGWSPDEELARSPLFQSLTGSKQNFYYSTAYPVSISVAADNLWRFRFSFGYNFCFFYASDPAIKGEKAYDVLHVLKPSVAFHASENVLVQLNYERWHIQSMLNGDHRSHSWNRLCMELKYIVQ